MRKILLVMLLFPFLSNAQNLKIESSKLIWQKVFNTPEPNNVIRQLESSGMCSNIVKTDSTFSAKLVVAPDYKGAGFSRGVTPMFLLAGNLSSGLFIELKEDRYRVTVSSMTLVDNVSIEGVFEQGTITPIERFSSKKSFTGKPSTIIDYTYNSVFSIKELSKDW